MKERGTVKYRKLILHSYRKEDLLAKWLDGVLAGDDTSLVAV